VAFVARGVKVGSMDKAPGLQKVQIKSDTIDGSATDFNARTEGLTMELLDGATVVWSATILPGDPDWKLASDTLKWKAKSAPHAAGLKAAKIGLSGRPFTVSVKAKDTDAVDAAGVSPITVRMTIGDDIFEGDLPCTTNSSGKSLKCG
jgi:hypothetical protein